MKDGGAAFPWGASIRGGMTLRDWFAGQALAGLLAAGPHDCTTAEIASDAYRHADSMLADYDLQSEEPNHGE